MADFSYINLPSLRGKGVEGLKVERGIRGQSEAPESPHLGKDSTQFDLTVLLRLMGEVDSEVRKTSEGNGTGSPPVR